MVITYNPYIIKGKVFEQMTSDEFFHFCQENEEHHLERDENGNIIFMPPTGGITGNNNSRIGARLFNWNEKNKLGETFESSTGFALPDGSVRSPDASWVSNEKWNALAEEEQQKFVPVCPEFVIELRSKTDRLPYLKHKMTKWIENGSQLAWLIDPIDQKAYIYRKNSSIEIVENLEATLSGEDVLEGFELNLRELK